jgi:carbonic anhydrase
MKKIASFVLVLCIWPISLVASGGETHWDYSGEVGPQYWGGLSEEFDICERGKNQSPINLMAVFHTDLPELRFDYKTLGDLAEVNTGHAIQENVTPGNFIVIKGVQFELKQFHFHSPSEHTVNGNKSPMEVHMVHQNDDGEYLVVGLMFEEGESNALMNELPSFRAMRGEDPATSSVDYNELILERTSYFLYNGSLTTPPCTEGVIWIIMKEPVIASPEQIQHYHDLLGFDNNRPVQPQNARIIVD